MSLLRVKSVETLYLDRIRALCGVSLEIERGEIFAVLGPNGAGKTTLLRTIAGLLPDQPARGVIELDGERIDRLRPEAIARLGVVYVPEDRGLFRELTVEENLRLGLWGKGEILRDTYAMFRSSPSALDKRRRRSQAESSRCWRWGAHCCGRPRLLLLDEPSLGLAPQMAKVVFDALRDISSAGTAIVLVEQNARLALRIARRAAILETGRIALEGSAQELLDHPDVREVYLGMCAAPIAQKAWRLHRKRRRW